MAGAHSILIVEDEPIIAMMLEEFVDMLGYGVAGVAESIDEALARIEDGGFDLAILDMNLRGASCWPIADALAARNVPFLFASGGHVDPPPVAHDHVPKLTKPYGLADVKTALDRLGAA